VLAETAAEIGDRQVRNRGTMGGSVAHGDPGADYPTVLTALGGTIVAAGPNGEREVPADDFFVDVLTTSLQPGEIVTAVRVPATGAGNGAAYVKHRHPASGYAVVGVAAAVGLDGGTCASARLAVGGVSGRPVRVAGAEEALVGHAPSDETIAAAAAHVPESFPRATGDTYASGEYRIHLATVLAARALAKAVAQAG
jgi:carbon-monoxide dehydrogenase medium subunit